MQLGIERSVLSCVKVLSRCKHVNFEETHVVGRWVRGEGRREGTHLRGRAGKDRVGRRWIGWDEKGVARWSITDETAMGQTDEERSDLPVINVRVGLEVGVVREKFRVANEAGHEDFAEERGVRSVNWCLVRNQERAVRVVEQAAARASSTEWGRVPDSCDREAGSRIACNS